MLWVGIALESLGEFVLLIMAFNYFGGNVSVPVLFIGLMTATLFRFGGRDLLTKNIF